MLARTARASTSLGNPSLRQKARAHLRPLHRLATKAKCRDFPLHRNWSYVQRILAESRKR